MSLKNRLQSVLGGEEFTEETVTVIPAEEQAIVLADGDIARAETVVAEHEEEITEIQHDIDVLEERLEDIEENVSGLEAMMSGESEWNPGLAMKMYRDAQKLSVRTFGESEKSPAVDGVESFADASTAQLVIVDGLEDIKERAKAAGSAIAEFFKNLYKSILAAFVGLFDRLRGIERRADALVSRLNGTSDEKLKDTIKLGSWNSYLEIDKNDNVLGKINGVADAVSMLGNALSSQTASGIKDSISGALDKVVSIVGNKKNSGSNGDETSGQGTIAGVTFKWTIPKVLKSLRTANVSYELNGDAKTDGEFKDSANVAKLISIAKRTKELATKARIAKFDQKALTVVRDRAIAVVKSAGGEDAAERISSIKAGHSVGLKMARVLTRYEGDVLIAAQKYISAHF